MWCSEECKLLYECIEGVCEHKNFWPPAFVELIGILLTGIFSSFASLAGIGGRCIVVSIFIQFFNYSEKEAVLIIFVPVFGASLGNFLNLINQVDPQSREPIFKNYFNQYFLLKSLIKFIKQGLKEAKMENERRKQQQNLIGLSELNDLSEPQMNKKEYHLKNFDAILLPSLLLDSFQWVTC